MFKPPQKSFCRQLLSGFISNEIITIGSKAENSLEKILHRLLFLLSDDMKLLTSG
jgi:hypothetical protein